MASSVFTGGRNFVQAVITTSGLASGLTVNAWKQGSAYPMTWNGSAYTANVISLGTYTVNYGTTDYRDVFVSGAGSYTAAF